MQIQRMKIEEIIPYWRNPRKNDTAIEKVKESIQKYGYTVPIILDKNNIIIAGHTRYKALKELDYKEVDVIVSDMDEDKAKQFRIVDNKTSEFASWDKEMLTYEMREMKELESLVKFFDEKELEKLLDIDIESIKFTAETEIPSILNDDEEENQVDNTEQDNSEELKIELERQKKEKELLILKLKKQEELELKIKEMEEKQKQQFSERSEKTYEDYIELSCPYCEEVYTISKDELLRRRKIQQNI